MDFRVNSSSVHWRQMPSPFSAENTRGFAMRICQISPQRVNWRSTEQGSRAPAVYGSSCFNQTQSKGTNSSRKQTTTEEKGRKKRRTRPVESQDGCSVPFDCFQGGAQRKEHSRREVYFYGNRCATSSHTPHCASQGQVLVIQEEGNSKEKKTNTNAKNGNSGGLSFSPRF